MSSIYAGKSLDEIPEYFCTGTYMQRVHTSGGLEPTTGCAQAADVGQQTLVPYTADYIFYKATGRE